MKWIGSEHKPLKYNSYSLKRVLTTPTFPLLPSTSFNMVNLGYGGVSQGMCPADNEYFFFVILKTNAVTFTRTIFMVIKNKC